MTAPLLGIFGGTFDPVHIGHLHSLWEVSEALSLDEVRIIPCAQSPLKGKTHTNEDHRWNMLELATQNQATWKLDGRELSRGGVSYTADTLKSLKKDFPKHHLCFILGMDAVEQLPQWRRWQEIVALAHLIVIKRPSHKKLPQTPWTLELERRSTQHYADLREKRSGLICWMNTTPLEISSTQIRESCGLGRTPPYVLPPLVYDYIKQHQLYQTEFL